MQLDDLEELLESDGAYLREEKRREAQIISNFAYDRREHRSSYFQQEYSHVNNDFRTAVAERRSETSWSQSEIAMMVDHEN